MEAYNAYYNNQAAGEQEQQLKASENHQVANGGKAGAGANSTAAANR